MLSKGEQVKLENGETACVLDEGPLGGGGQGDVYRVEYRGKTYAMKYYTSKEILDNVQFMKNLRENINHDPPSDKFLWPQYMVSHEGHYGYLMDLIPEGFYEMSYLLRTEKYDRKTRTYKPVKFRNLEVSVLAAMNIVKAFRELHRCGYSFQDINNGGIFLDTETGDIRICDCDNISPFGYNFGIRGKPMYMAPEVYLGDAPNTDSDEFSLAIVLFMILVREDPFQGKAFLAEKMVTDDVLKRFYGTDPVFIFDPDDDSNRPVPGIHRNAVNNWPMLPEYIHKMFVQTFTEGLKNPKARAIDHKWLTKLKMLRSDVVSCGDHERYTETPLSRLSCYQCPECGDTYPVFKIYTDGKLTERFVLTTNTRVLRYQVDRHEPDDLETVVGVVSESKSRPGNFGLKNISDMTWIATTTDGTKTLTEGVGAPIGKIVEVDFGNGIIGRIER